MIFINPGLNSSLVELAEKICHHKDTCKLRVSGWNHTGCEGVNRAPVKGVQTAILASFKYPGKGKKSLSLLTRNKYIVKWLQILQSL